MPLASQNVRQRTDSGVNYAQKSFMKLTTGVNVIKLFWHNLCPQRHALGQNVWQYADSGVNYAEKSFMKLATGVGGIQLFVFVTNGKAN